MVSRNRQNQTPLIQKLARGVFEVACRKSEVLMTQSKKTIATSKLPECNSKLRARNQLQSCVYFEFVPDRYWSKIKHPKPLYFLYFTGSNVIGR